MISRVRQFVIGVFERPTEKDYAFVNEHLNDDEKKLFFMLPYYEQMHGIRVARNIFLKYNDVNINNDIVIRAALLHDIGKYGSGLNLITKSCMVILDKLFHKHLVKHDSIKIIDAYYNHPEIAMTYLKQEPEEIKYLILNHHNYKIQNRALNILQNADDKN